jgi:hypothetical protein
VRKGSLLAAAGARLSVASALPSRGAARETLVTSLASLDRLLAGGLPKGALVELASRRSSGRLSAGIAALAAVTSRGEPAAFVDLGNHLDPQCAQIAGVDLNRLLWARPERLKEAVAAAEMLLAAGFPLVVLDLGVPPLRGRFVPDAVWVRLARSAEARAAVLLLTSPYRVSGIAAETVIAADSARAVWEGGGLSPRLLQGISSRLTLEKNAGGSAGRKEMLALSVAEALISRESSPQIRNSKFEIRNSPPHPPQIRNSQFEIRNSSCPASPAS